MHDFKVYKKKYSGFTLIELLVAITIFMLFIGVGVAGYNQFNERQKVRQAILNLKNNLRFAQTKAISSEKTPGVACIKLIGYRVDFISSQVYTISELCDNNNNDTIEIGQSPPEIILQNSYSLLSQNINFTSYPSSLLFRPVENDVIINSNPPTTDVVITINNPAILSYQQTLTVSKSGDITGPN
jgi:prepilin-type N-terminal cleavage/methylation domain-containing protein